jgi:glycosyltransferase involved in cell wall biosynthesis
MSDRRVLFAGFAGKVGGAGTESFETARFFIARGPEVHMVPTWESPEPVRRQEVDALGVVVHCIKPAQVGDLLRELGCPPVVSFCNPGFLTHYRRFKEHSPTVWINCMTSVSGEERNAWKKHGLPSAFVFQSEFQRRILENRLARHQYRPELGHLIRGAFCWDTWDYAPLAREPGAPFVVGRAARPDPAKWSSHTLEALDPVPNVRATCLGADDRIRRQIGSRKYTQLLAPGAVSSREFYRNLHAMICYNSTAKENWPRVGLEAMATGVPLVADGHWGWTEMIRHGETGFLARRTSEFTEYLRLLEADEHLRQRIAQQARHALETDLANPDAIWAGWCGIWRDIGAGHLTEVQSASPPETTELQCPQENSPSQKTVK